MINVDVALLYRVENNVIFEELKTMDKSSNSLTTILEKDSKLLNTFIHWSTGNYWIYHKNVIEEPDEEKLNPADKAWLIVKYVNPNNSSHKVLTLHHNLSEYNLFVNIGLQDKNRRHFEVR